MRQPNFKSNKDQGRQHVRMVFLILWIILLAGCIGQRVEEKGIVFIAERGRRPAAQSITWSPIDENKVLVNAYEIPEQPAEIFILDLQTGEKEYIAGPMRSAQFIEAKWMPDGKSALILAVDTKGFEPSGWWAVDISSKSAEHLLGVMDNVAWSPDLKYVSVIQRKPNSNGNAIELKLIDTESKNERILVSNTEFDYSGGISWSPDSKFLVFSLGKYQSSSNLFVVNVENGEALKISENNKSEEPAWSPKGNIIAFESNNHLHLISFDGKCEVEIPNLENAWSPTWSPDGMKLGYISGDGIYYIEIEKILGWDIYEGLCK